MAHALKRGLKTIFKSKWENEEWLIHSIIQLTILSIICSVILVWVSDQLRAGFLYTAFLYSTVLLNILVLIFTAQLSLVSYKHKQNKDDNKKRKRTKSHSKSDATQSSQI